MTDDEKRQQKGELLLSFQEAHEHWVSLREKAREIHSKLEGVQIWLAKLTNSSQSSDLLRADFYSQQHSGMINILGDASFRKAMDYEQVVSLTQEVIGALKRVEELGSRKRELGLK